MVKYFNQLVGGWGVGCKVGGVKIINGLIIVAVIFAFICSPLHKILMGI